MTFGELRYALLKMAPGTDADKLDTWINGAYASILGRRSWKGLEADAAIATSAVYETGTVTLVEGSQALVGVATAWTAAVDTFRFYIGSRLEPYTFAYVSATTGTLDRAYEGGSGSGLAYKLYKDTYDLPDDFARPFQSKNERLPGEIIHMDRKELGRSTIARQFGEPMVYSIVSDSAADVRRAQLFPIPSDAASYPFTYIRRAPDFTEGDTATELLPWVRPKAVMDLVRAEIEKDRKNYNGAAAYTVSGEAEISSMLVNDAKEGGPKRLRMAPTYTRHRLDRAFRSYRRQLP